MNEWMSNALLFQMEKPSESDHWISIYEHGKWSKQLSKMTFSVKVQVLAYTSGMEEKNQATLSFIFLDIGHRWALPAQENYKAGKEKEKQGVGVETSPGLWGLLGILLRFNSSRSLERIEYDLFRAAVVGNNDFWFKAGGKLCIGWIT